MDPVDDPLFASPRPLDALERVGLGSRPFTRQEALRRGLSRYALDRLVAENVVRRPLRNGYVPAALPDTVATRAACLARTTPPNVVVVDRTAAWLWGVDAYSLAETTGVVPIDAFSIRGADRLRRQGIRAGTRALLPEDVVPLGGVLVTSPLRTAVDLACGLRRYEALGAVDAMMRAQGLTRDELLRLLPRFRGRRGVVQAREVLNIVDARAESQGESFLRLVMLDEGFPVPDLQVWVHNDEGAPVYRLDHAYEGLKIGIEYDGVAHHTSEADRRYDAERRAWLVARGWIIITVGKADLPPDSRGHWIHELRAARAERLEEQRVQHARPVQRSDRITRAQVRAG